MSIRELLRSEKVIYLDGGMGTLLQELGLKAGELPERWNLERPDVIAGIHRQYFNAGANIVNVNTFGANGLKFEAEELEKIIAAAIENAKKGAADSTGTQEKYVALDLGPSGRLLKPYGDFEFEEAVSLFGEVVRLGAKYGADLVTIETMADSYETKAAMLAVKENSDLPFIVTNAYGEDEKLMTGASPEAMVALIEGMGADALGVNCSLGPDKLKPVVERMLKTASIPVILKPNAGLPRNEGGKTVYDVNADTFANQVEEMVADGVKIVGGCCGTTPEFIKKVVEQTEKYKVPYPEEKEISWISSYTHAVAFGEEPILIGERLNPTGKKRLKQALIEEDMDYILQEGIRQQDSGAKILDVNVGLPEIDEPRIIAEVTKDLQSVINLPLCLDTSKAEAMEAGLRCYNGKAIVNSVNGKQESMDAIFPIVAKYGGMVVALTLDDEGIPEDVEGRIAIAKKIIEEAAKYGIRKKDLIFDALTMTVSADPTAPEVTLETVRRIKEELGCHTVLGVSNVSFGLPNRSGINSVFFGAALHNGLSAAIMNPLSMEMMGVYYSHKALHNMDENFAEYIRFSEEYEASKAAAAPAVAATTADAATNSAGATAATSGAQGVAGAAASDLQYAIIKGLKDQAMKITKEIIGARDSLEIIKEEIIPALNIVGDGFERKEVYLPQLLMSAEAAGASFDVIKEKLVNSDEWNPDQNRSKIVVATVKGDIHDIGKNIVKLLLQNYGFDVIDLGKDVAPEAILEAVTKDNVPLVGLSALMTTTVPAMEETIKLLRESAPWCKVLVGGAVLNQSYADMIGADSYGRDAMDTVRFAEAHEE